MKRLRRRRERVEVRETPAGRELRIDGTFASSYRTGSATTGSVWDGIAAPTLLLPDDRAASMLLLGLGGGSVARVARALRPGLRIVGVEFDAQVVEVARREFHLDELGVEIVIADALELLQQSREHFDIVIDDVFVGRGRGVHKPGWLPEPGHELARDRLSEGGLLVSNALDEAPAVTGSMRRLFPGVLRIDVEEYDNRIVVGGPAELSATELRRRVSESAVLASTLPLLRFRTITRAGADR